MSENGEVSILVVDGTNLVSEVSRRLLACYRSLSAIHCMSEHAMQMCVLCQMLNLMQFIVTLFVYRHAQGMGQLPQPLQPLAGKQGNTLTCLLHDRDRVLSNIQDLSAPEAL